MMLSASNIKKKRKRTLIPPHHLSKLDSLFKKEQWPTRVKKEELARELGRTEQFVSIWFQNRRARMKKEELSIKPYKDEQYINEVSIKQEVSPTSQASNSQNSGEQVHEESFKRQLTTKTKTPFIQNMLKGDIKHVSPMTLLVKPMEKSLPTIEDKIKHERNESELDKDNTAETITLLHALLNMICVREGGVMSSQDPELPKATNDALYGINVNNETRLVYNTYTGVELIPMISEPIDN